MSLILSQKMFYILQIFFVTVVCYTSDLLLSFFICAWWDLTLMMLN